VRPEHASARPRLARIEAAKIPSYILRIVGWAVGVRRIAEAAILTIKSEAEVVRGILRQPRKAMFAALVARFAHSPVASLKAGMARLPGMGELAVRCSFGKTRMCRAAGKTTTPCAARKTTLRRAARKTGMRRATGAQAAATCPAATAAPASAAGMTVAAGAPAAAATAAAPGSAPMTAATAPAAAAATTTVAASSAAASAAVTAATTAAAAPGTAAAGTAATTTTTGMSVCSGRTGQNQERSGD